MPTIYDVAKLAGVSSMTVSRSLNTPEIVKPDTRARINAAVDELGYRKNHAARALVLQSTGIIKISMSAGLRGNHLYFSQLFAGITDVLSENKFAMILADHQADDVACDGVILMGLSLSAQREVALSRTPLVLFGKGAEMIDWIDVDNEQGCFDATQHLLELGHRKIGFLTFPSTEPFINEREAGYLKAMQDAGLPVQPSWSACAKNNSVEAGYACGHVYLQNKETTAVVCCSDHVAAGLAQAAYDLDINVPTELSIVGFDGVGQERMAKPILTTMQQPVFEIGQRLASELVSRIREDKPEFTNERINPTMIVNESTAAPHKFFT